MPVKVKVEINCREHITALGLISKDYAVESSWFTGRCAVCTYRLEELLGSKLRALYQRRKGRDLFDIWYCISTNPVDIPDLLASFHAFMKHVGAQVSVRTYIANIEAKLKYKDFRDDTTALLSSSVSFDIDKAWLTVRKNIFNKRDATGG